MFFLSIWLFLAPVENQNEEQKHAKCEFKCANSYSPAVSFGPRQREVKQSQTGEGGLSGVRQSPGAAEPGEPGAQVAKELKTSTGSFQVHECWMVSWREELENDKVFPTVHLETSSVSNVRMSR